MIRRFFGAFLKASGFNQKLYGVDIIVDSRDGTHYVIDLNYLPNYSEVPRKDLQTAFDTLVRKQIAIHMGEAVEDDTDGEDYRYLSYAAVGIAAIAVMGAAVYKGWRRAEGEQ